MSSLQIDVVGSVFVRPGREGDFAWMLTQREYDDALFLFNDNEQQFRAHRNDPQSPLGCSPGGGNAVIRPWQCLSPPRAAGIPTGSSGAGYASLTPNAQALIDEALANVRSLLASGRYRRVYFSSDGQGGLGTGIFQVGDDVKAYIVAGICALAATDDSTRHGQ